MNENAKKWVEALRSGKYKQTIGRLKDSNGFCCLGVACELAVQAGIISPPEESNPAFFYGVAEDRSWSELPKTVRDWMGLQNSRGDFKKGPTHNLVALNDDGASFEDIAALIESQPDGLFVE